MQNRRAAQFCNNRYQKCLDHRCKAESLIKNSKHCGGTQNNGCTVKLRAAEARQRKAANWEQLRTRQPIKCLGSSIGFDDRAQSLKRHRISVELKSSIVVKGLEAKQKHCAGTQNNGCTAKRCRGRNNNVETVQVHKKAQNQQQSCLSSRLGTKSRQQKEIRS